MIKKSTNENFYQKKKLFHPRKCNLENSNLKIKINLYKYYMQTWYRASKENFESGRYVEIRGWQCVPNLWMYLSFHHFVFRSVTTVIMVIVSGGFQREIISTAKFEHHALLSILYFNLGGYIVDFTAIQPFYEYGSLLVPRTLYPHNCRNGERRVGIKIAIIGYIQAHSPP